MKRLIIDSKKMTPEILALVKEKYPEGYYEDDIIVFKNHKNETIEAIQVESEDAVYLIKIGKYLSVGLENFHTCGYFREKKPGKYPVIFGKLL